ncbi:MAG: PqiB family protein [Acidiferrobacter sp.]
MNDPTNTPTAKVQHTRWPGLIWAVPIAALAIVLWLGLRSYMEQGPSVTVRFDTIGGIKPDHTVVKYRGVTVGQVTAVRLSKSLDEIWVTIHFEPYMGGHLGQGTRFWVADEHVSVADLSSLKSIIAGPYIGIDPHPGHTVTHFIGLDQEPVLKSEPKGVTVVLRTSERHNISRGAPIFYKGYRIGEIRGVAMLPSGSTFDIYAFIPEKYLHLANRRSRFWNSGRVQLNLLGPHAGVNLPPIPALLSGAITFSTPAHGAPVRDNEVFPLYNSATAALNAPGQHAVSYRLTLPGGPQSLNPGAPVLLEGTRVGSVTAVQMHYDPHDHHLSTDIRIVLEPQRIPLATPARWNLADPRPQMNRLLRHLIAQGVRAELRDAIPVVGPKVVALEQISGAPPARLIAGTPPQIPLVSSTGIHAVVAQINTLMHKINAMPLPEIAQNIHVLSRQLAQLSRSPQTRKTLAHLNQSIAHLDRLTQTADTRLPDILKALQAASTQADRALQAANAVLHSNGAAANSPESTTLPRALYELSQVAQSLRALTDYLDSHPSALVFGKRP